MFSYMKAFGEKWVNPGSYVQLVGLLVSGCLKSHQILEAHRIVLHVINSTYCIYGTYKLVRF